MLHFLNQFTIRQKILGLIFVAMLGIGVAEKVGLFGAFMRLFGNKDGLIRISQGVHAYLKEHGVAHIWHVDEHAHDFNHWKKALYQFSQLVFAPVAK